MYVYIYIVKLFQQYTVYVHALYVGQDSLVGKAPCYLLDSPGIESRWGREIFHTRPEWSWDPPSLLRNGYRVFHEGEGVKAAEAWR